MAENRTDLDIFNETLNREHRKHQEKKRDEKRQFNRNFETRELTPYERKVQASYLINGTNFVLDELAQTLSRSHHATFLPNEAYNQLKLGRYDQLQVPKVPFQQFTTAENTAYTQYSALLNHKQRLGEQLVRLHNDGELKKEWRSLEKALVDCNTMIDDEISDGQLPKDAIKYWELIQDSPSDYFDYIRRSRNRDSHSGFVDDPLELYLHAYFMTPSIRFGLGAGDDNSLQHYLSEPYPKMPPKTTHTV